MTGVLRIISLLMAGALFGCSGVSSDPDGNPSTETPDLAQAKSQIDAQPFGGGELAWDRAKIVQKSLRQTLAKIRRGEDVGSLCAHCAWDPDAPGCEKMKKLSDPQRRDAREFLLDVSKGLSAFAEMDVKSLITFSGAPLDVDGKYVSARTMLSAEGKIEINGNDWLAMKEEDAEALLAHEFGHKVISPRLGAHLSDEESYQSFPSGSELLTAAAYCLVSYRFEHSSYAEQVLDEPALLAYWRLNEASGDIALDSSGNGNHASYNNLIKFRAKGALAYDHDSAVEIDGKTRSIIRATLPTLDITTGKAVTVEMWLKIKGEHMVVPFSFDSGHSLMLRKSFLGEMSTSGRIKEGGVGNLSNKWAHVVWEVHNGDSTRSRVFVNGELLTFTHIDANFPAAFTASKTIIIGGGRDAKDTEEKIKYAFTGQVDEIAIYNEALTASQVRRHYRLAVSRAE